MKKTFIAAFAVCAFASIAEARELRIVGSSTVYPFTTIVSETFAKNGNPAPVVESTGTGGQAAIDNPSRHRSRQADSVLCGKRSKWRMEPIGNCSRREGTRLRLCAERRKALRPVCDCHAHAARRGAHRRPGSQWHHAVSG